jgi:glycosyltransferase involved in cell wall biosynthesis
MNNLKSTLLGSMFSIYRLYCRFLDPYSLIRLLILGNNVLSKSDWNISKIKLKYLEKKWNKRTSISNYENLPRRMILDNELKVSIIVSIYHSDQYLDYFLSNILEQTFFCQSEFIFILADPSKEEKVKIKKFCDSYSNCIYEIFDTRITIYKAWNVAISKASADLITNMNTDDLRRNDSLELQYSFMQSNPDVHIGYQDFYFFQDLDSDWASIVSINDVANLPVVDFIQLAWFGINPPHNAPVWRKSIHAVIGLFDDELKSAGDYEMWLRCLLHDFKFKKMQDKHVGYYVNHIGMSTSADSPSATEEKMIQTSYRKKFLISRNLDSKFIDPAHIEELIRVSKI